MLLLPIANELTSLETFSKLRPPDCVKIKVKRKNTNDTFEIKQLCVDPQITSFDILQSLIAQAFSIKSDFVLSYLNREKSKQQQNEEMYTSLWNDWDLDAAFMNSSNPHLSVIVELKDNDNLIDDWDVISAVDLPRNYSIMNVDGGRSLIATWGNNAADKAVSIFQKMFNGLSKSNNLTQKNNKSKKYQKQQQHQLYQELYIHKNNNNNLNYDQNHPYFNLFENIDDYKWKQPLGDSEFRNFLDSDGRIIQPNELKQRIFEGGIDHKLRKVIWRFLLNIYPNGLTGQQRVDYVKSLSEQYYRLKSMWFNKPHILNDDDIKPIAHKIQKDVYRTDRTIHFYSGDGNHNIKSLFNILLTYSLTHSSISYAQGMSDLLSPILYILRDEAQAYVCFCSLMKRLKSNFSIHSDSIELKIKLLQSLLKEYDPELWDYLENVGAADQLVFVYRWLLLECKREFSFYDSLRMFEIMWSSLKTIEVDNIEQLCLYEDDTSIHRSSISSSVSSNSNTFDVHDVSLNANTTLTTTSTNAASATTTSLTPPSLKQNHSNATTPITTPNSIISTTSSNIDTTDNVPSRQSENKTKRFKCKKTLEFNSLNANDCKKKLMKSHRKFDTEDEDDDDDDDDYNDNENEINISQRLKQQPRDIHNNCDTDSDNDNDVQLTLVPETASKLLLNFARSHSDSNINLIFNNNKNSNNNNNNNNNNMNGSKQNIELNLIATPTKQDCSGGKKTKSLDICFMFERSISDSKLNKTTNTTANDCCNDKITSPATTKNKSRHHSNKSKHKKSRSSSIVTSTSCSCSNSLFNSYSGSYEQQSTSSNESTTNSSKSSIKSRIHQSSSSLLTNQQDKESDNNHDIALPTITDVATTIATTTSTSATAIPTPTVATNSTTTLTNNSLKRTNTDLNHKKNIDSGYCSDVTNSPLIQTNEDLIYSLSKLDNPFLLFLCLTLFIENRDSIINSQLDANDIACYFDKMIRKHNSKNVLNHARHLYTKLYLSKVNVFNYIQQLINIQNSP